MESLVYNKNIDTEHSNEWGNTVEGCEEAMDIIKEYENIIRTNKKNIFLHINKVKFLENLRKEENLKVLLNNLI